MFYDKTMKVLSFISFGLLIGLCIAWALPLLADLFLAFFTTGAGAHITRCT